MSKLIKSFLDVQGHRMKQMSKESQVMFEHQPFLETFEQLLDEFKAEQQLHNSRFWYCAPDEDYWLDPEHIWMQCLQYVTDTPFRLQVMVHHVPDYAVATAFCEFTHKQWPGHSPLYWRTERTPNYLTFHGHTADWPQLSLSVQLSANTFCVGTPVTKTVMEYKCSDLDGE